jgi:hypothetical protein
MTTPMLKNNKALDQAEYFCNWIVAVLESFSH